MRSRFAALEPFAELDANWRETLRAAERIVVYVWAIWSPPDRAFASVLARVTPDYAEQFAFFTADVDDETLALFSMEIKL